MKPVSRIHFALALSAAFWATAVPAQESGDETVLAMDAGRLVAMLDQASVLLKAGEAKEPDGEDPVLALDFALNRYNILRQIACARAVMEGPECASAYTPVLRRPPVSVSVLRQELDDAEAHILPFWEAVCTKLDDPARHTCQME